MRDLASLSGPQLDARLRDAIARRLEAGTAEERGRAGEDVTQLARERRRRESGRDDEPDARTASSRGHD